MCDAHRRAFLTKSAFAVAAMGAASFGVAQAQTQAQTQAPVQPAPAGAVKAKWSCPPCGCPADGREFDAPGPCPECGMTMIQKTATAPKTPGTGEPAKTPPDPRPEDKKPAS